VITALPTIGAQIEARANHPAVTDRVFLIQHEREWTFRQYRDECVRIAHFLLRRLGPIDERRPGHVAMLLENHLELLALYGGCAYAGLSLFGVNTGLRGDTLAGVVNQSGARLLVVDERAPRGRARGGAPRGSAENCCAAHAGERISARGLLAASSEVAQAASRSTRRMSRSIRVAT
jgi:acyl-CoA synthetase (AMP-forming)/AMP-acid ligase II